MLATAALTPALAHAQGSTGKSDSCTGTLYAPIVVTSATSTTVNCTVGGVVMSGSASAVGGVVRATSSTVLTNDTRGAYAVQTFAQWTDQLQLGANSGVFEVEFRFVVNGTLANGYLNGLGWNSDFTVFRETTGYAEIHAGVATGPSSVVTYSNRTSPFTGPAASKSVNEEFNFKLRVDAWGNVDFRYGLQALSVVRNTSEETYLGPTFGESLFGSSAGITGIRFFDTNNQLIDGPIDYQFANGTGFYDPDAATVVPEPSAWALLVLGLMMVGVAARSRRTAA